MWNVLLVARCTWPTKLTFDDSAQELSVESVQSAPLRRSVSNSALPSNLYGLWYDTYILCFPVSVSVFTIRLKTGVMRPCSPLGGIHICVANWFHVILCQWECWEEDVKLEEEGPCSSCLLLSGFLSASCSRAQHSSRASSPSHSSYQIQFPISPALAERASLYPTKRLERGPVLPLLRSGFWLQGTRPPSF